MSLAPQYLPGGEESDYDSDLDEPARKPSNQPPTMNFSQFGDEVKIIPKLGYQAGLNKSDFDISLDTNADGWFQQIHNYWRQYKKSPTLSHFIQQFYATSPNPFAFALKFYANCHDASCPKQNSLAYIIIAELNSYKKTFGAQNHLNDNLKMVAFNFLKRSGQITTFRLAVDTFELLSSSQIFLGEIRELLNLKLYKEVGQIACDLQLYNEFTIDDFLIPLFLQDKLGILEDYLDKAQHLRRPMIELLDSFLDRDASVRNLCDSFIVKYQLSDVKYDKLHKKPISKLVNRLLKKYRLSDTIAPNSRKHKEFGSLNFILRKNYYEKSLSQASFEEMIKDTVGTNRELQIELVYMTFTCYGAYEDAVMWTKFFEVPLDEVPSIVREKVEGTYVAATGDGWDEPPPPIQEIKTVDEDVHKLSIDHSDVIIVDTIDSYRQTIARLQQSKMIAFDTEWKPTISADNDVSLIQLAVKDAIYLIDVISLTQKRLSREDWSLLGKAIFNNNEILKLGFSHATDISMLMKFEALTIQDFQKASHSYLDLQGLWQKTSTICEFEFPYHQDVTSYSLSNLVKLCFGKKLDKSNQFSNWQQRPLRREQIFYAALDAYCLLEIYDVIANVINNIGINYDLLIDSILIENKKEVASIIAKESQSRAFTQSSNSFQNVDIPRNPVTVHNIRFVTDFMLGSLGRILRQVGCDTVIMRGTFVDHDECIRASMKDDRVILTASKQLTMQRYINHVKLGNVYCVRNYSNDLQGLDEVIRQFKINVQPQNLFSRCMVCNGDNFLVASKLQMIRLKYNGVQIPKQLMQFVRQETEFSTIQVPDNKFIQSWRPLGDHEKTTENGCIIDSSEIHNTTLGCYQTFYVCNGCAKIYWDGAHFRNNCGGKFEGIFNLFPEA